MRRAIAGMLFAAALVGGAVIASVRPDSTLRAVLARREFDNARRMHREQTPSSDYLKALREISAWADHKGDARSKMLADMWSVEVGSILKMDPAKLDEWKSDVLFNMRCAKFFHEAPQWIVALEPFPLFDERRTDAADVYWNLDRVEDAKKVLGPAPFSAPGIWNALIRTKFEMYEHLAQARFAQAKEVVTHLRRAANLVPQFAIEADALEAVIARREGRLNKALEYCRQGEARAVDMKESLSGGAFMSSMECTRALVELGRYSEAERQNRRMLEFAHKIPMFRGFLEWQYQHERARVQWLSDRRIQRPVLEAMRQLIEKEYVGAHYLRELELWELLNRGASPEELREGLRTEIAATGRYSDFIEEFRELILTHASESNVVRGTNQ